MIDPDILAFVEESERFYPADAASSSIAEQRRLYDRYAAAFAVARPAGVTSGDADLTLAGRHAVALRRYRPGGSPPRGTILYAHGGGFVLGSLDSHDGIAARICAALAADVVAVDYRLAPDHPAPAALDDVLAAARAVIAGASPWPDLPRSPLVLMGDSAGATLAAIAALHLGRAAVRPPTVPTGLWRSAREENAVEIDAGVPVGAVTALALVYPALGYEPAEPARTEEASAPMLSLADVHVYRDIYLAGRPRAAADFPLDAVDLGVLPPTGLLPAEHDPLRDDCTVLAQRLAALGTPHVLVSGTGLVHGFLRALDRSAAAARAFDALMRFIDQAFDDAARTPA